MDVSEAALKQIEQRVLWLATRIVHEANLRSGGEVKVGGHQASCASMVSIMTAMWFNYLRPEDKAAVKPHASPVYHAIKYLTGELDGSYLTTLRQRGGLQVPITNQGPRRLGLLYGVSWSWRSSTSVCGAHRALCGFPLWRTAR